MPMQIIIIIFFFLGGGVKEVYYGLCKYRIVDLSKPQMSTLCGKSSVETKQLVNKKKCGNDKKLGLQERPVAIIIG